MSARPRTPREALQCLIEGNERFVRRAPLHSTVSEEAFVRLRDSQRPFAVILGCSDSRVPPELVFDQGFGDLFVIRLAGNVIEPSVFGSIQYAHMHLGTSLLVVLGHEGCGAVKAALVAKFKKVKHPERIQSIVDLIDPALKDVHDAKQLPEAIEANVRWSIHQLVSSPEAQRAFQDNRDVLVVGAVYELQTGIVRWLADKR
jgi:carbonic anhydrase